MERDRDAARTERVREALETQHAVSHALHRGNMQDWAHLDLSMGQLKALMTLASSDDMNVSELAERLQVSKPTASILVDRLVQLGYCERTEDTEDRRRTLVAPTDKGRELVVRLQQGGSERMARWLELMDSDDVDALTRGLRALAATISSDIGSRAVGAETSETASRRGEETEE